MLATAASRTSVLRLQRALAAAGIKSNITQTPSALTKEGCGYSLRLDERHIKDVQAAAKELRITIRAFFAENNGEYNKIDPME